MINLLVTEALIHLDKINIIISGDANKCVVALVPIAKKDGVNIQPITMSGPSDEIEEALVDAIKQIFTDNKGIFSNVKQVVEQLKADVVVKQQEDEKKEISKKEEKSKKESPAAKEISKKYTKIQKDAVKKADDCLERAKAENDDGDMITFLKNQAAALYKNADLTEEWNTTTEIKWNELIKSKSELFDKTKSSDKDEKQNIKEAESEDDSEQVEDEIIETDNEPEEAEQVEDEIIETDNEPEEAEDDEDVIF